MLTSAYTTVVNDSYLQALGPFRPMTSGGIVASQFQEAQKANIIRTEDAPMHAAAPANNADDWMESAYATMLLSEDVLARDWNTPEEDEAWGDL